MGILPSCWWAIRETLAAGPAIFLGGAALSLVAGLMPSLQVELVRKLTESAGSNSATATLWAVLSGVAIAGYLGMTNVSNSLLRMSQINAYARNMGRINERLTRLTPQEIGDQGTQMSARNARDSVLEGGAQLQATSAVAAAQAVVVVVSLALSIARVSPIAAVMVCGAVVPMGIASMWFATQDAAIWPQISAARRRALYEEDQITYQTTAAELASLNAREAVSRRATTQRSQSRRREILLETKNLMADSASSIAATVFLVLALLALLHSDATAGEVTGGVIGVFSGILATANVGFVIGSLRSGANAISRFRDFVDHDTDEARRQPPASSDGAGLVISDLTVTYPGAARPAVDAVSLDVRRGEVVGLVGVNGAGKSSLVKAVTRLAPITQGRIILDGDDLSAMSYPSVTERVAMLAQDYGRYEYTVRDFLLLGVPAASEADVRHALHEVGFDDVVRALPDGLETQLGEQWGGVGLSGGQWQRLALARVFLKNTLVRILDEPTSAIDAEAEEEIFRSIRELAPGHVTLVVSHRAWTLKNLDRIYVIDAGRIVEQGTYDDLMRQRGRFSEIFSRQGEDTESAG